MIVDRRKKQNPHPFWAGLIWLAFFNIAYCYYFYGPASISLPIYFLFLAVLGLARELRSLRDLIRSVVDRRKTRG